METLLYFIESIKWAHSEFGSRHYLPWSKELLGVSQDPNEFYGPVSHLRGAVFLFLVRLSASSPKFTTQALRAFSIILVTFMSSGPACS